MSGMSRPEFKNDKDSMGKLLGMLERGAMKYRIASKAYTVYRDTAYSLFQPGPSATAVRLL